MSLLDENKETFLRYVNDDIRDAADEAISRELRSPECLDRWYRALLAMKRDAETQFALDQAERSEKRLEITDRDEWLEYVAVRDRWRAGNIRFKNGVENKLDEAKHLIRAREKRLAGLESAIRAHEQGMGDQASDIDLALWEVLS